MLRLQQEHLDYIADLYDLVLSPSDWCGSLGTFCSFIGAGGSSLHVMDTRNDAASLTCFGGRLTEEIQNEYNELYASVDTEALAVLFAERRRRFVHDFEALGLRKISEIEDHAPIRWLNEKAGLFWRVASRLNLNGAWMDVITFQFERAHGPMSGAEKTFCAPFLPHFAKVVYLGRIFRILEQRFRTMMVALDRLNIGLMVVLDDARVVIANAEGERILELDDGMFYAPGKRLRLAEPVTGERLKRAIADAAATVAGEGDLAECLLKVKRRSGLPSFLLSVSPIRDDQGVLEEGIKGALVFVLDPENRENLSAEGLDQLYGLTKTEFDVLEKLLDGYSTVEISQARGTAVETVRTQVKSIMSKTCTRRKSDLIRLAASVNLPFKDEH